VHPHKIPPPKTN
jgi:hypothetical protein